MPKMALCNIDEFLSQLRERADGQHRSAIVAISILGDYLRTPTDNVPDRIAALIERAGISTNGNGKTNRELVLSCIREEWLTVEEITCRTGLVAKRIRSVLYDPKVKHKLISQSSGGQLRFKLRKDQ